MGLRLMLVTPGPDPRAQAATIAGRRASLILDARVNPRIKSGDAHDAKGGRRKPAADLRKRLTAMQVRDSVARALGPGLFAEDKREPLG